MCKNQKPIKGPLFMQMSPHEGPVYYFCMEHVFKWDIAQKEGVLMILLPGCTIPEPPKPKEIEVVKTVYVEKEKPKMIEAAI